MTAQPVLEGMPDRPGRRRLRPVQVDPWVGPGRQVLADELDQAAAALNRMEATT